MAARKWTIKGLSDRPYLEAEGPALVDGESITAYDSRDVDPLIEAARDAITDFTDGRVGRLQKALASFDSEES